MKKIFAGLIAFTIISFTASAQTQKPGESEKAGSRGQHKDKINPRVLDQLELSASQKEQIKAINDDYRAKMQEMIKSEIPAEERKNKRSSLETEKKNKILAILTAEQVKKLKELQSNPGMYENNNGEYKEKFKSDGEKTKIKIDDEKTKTKVEKD